MTINVAVKNLKLLCLTHCPPNFQPALKHQQLVSNTDQSEIGLAENFVLDPVTVIS